jgi:3-methylcrotonyl-CoA carboxylase alpha subunit
MCAAAVRLARQADYRNAGTVEFLLDGEEFYFLEMNARLQVEHPVTELVTGLDLVHLQLAVAAGEPLPFSQEDVSLRGSAIEARLYAEEDGLPAGGKLLAFAPPEGPGIRNDTGVEAGDEVSLNYDPMLAKLIVCAPDRDAAVRRLRRSLHDYSVLGVPTNLPLLRRIAGHPAYATGETTVRFLEEHRLTEALPDPEAPPEAVLLAAAAGLALRASADPFAAGPWRNLGAARFRYQVGKRMYVVEAERSAGALKLRLDGRQAVVEVISEQDGQIRAIVDGQAVSAGLAFDGLDALVSLGGESYRLSKPPPPDVDRTGPGGADAPSANLTAPMPGTVVKVLVGEGDEVEEGQVLLVLEAMKMEQPVAAPHAGRIASLPYGEGTLVPGGAVLAEIEEP